MFVLCYEMGSQFITVNLTWLSAHGHSEKLFGNCCFYLCLVYPSAFLCTWRKNHVVRLQCCQYTGILVGRCKGIYNWTGLPRIHHVANMHSDIIKWEHFPHYWPFVWGIHQSSVNSLHKGQWHGALILSSMCAWINSWVNSREAGDLRRHHAHYDITVMEYKYEITNMHFVHEYQHSCMDYDFM